MLESLDNMQVEWVPIGSIEPWEKNPRRISEEAFNGLRESIKRFGMPQPIIANRVNNRIVGGHMRWRAAQAEGWEKVPVIWVDLNEAQEAALNITLNNRHIAGEFTDDVNEIRDWTREQIGEVDFNSLRLDKVEFDLSWTSDIDKVDQIEESDGLAPGIIKVKTPPQHKDELVSLIEKLIKENGYEGVEIS